MISADNSIRLAVFIGIFAILAIIETLLPKKARIEKRSKRWPINLALTVINAVLPRLVMPGLAVGMAGLAGHFGLGLFNQLDLPGPIELLASIIMLDLAIYAQHLAMHRFPILWAFHKIHHIDRDIDVTTGLRFHPVEILLSMLFKMLCVVLIGPTAATVILFEIILNATAMFSHANIRLSSRLDTAIRLITVTPDMHRIHHSEQITETNSNYGFCLSWWDRLFGTYRRQPEHGHAAMLIGLPQYRTKRHHDLFWNLFLPFRRQ